jgi:hypothetical protein
MALKPINRPIQILSPESNGSAEKEAVRAPVAAPTDRPAIRIYKPNIGKYLLKLLVYGQPGVGKTSLLATANLHPLTAPILIINVEGGMLSVSDASVLGLKEAPDVTDLRSFDDLERIFWFLAKGDHPYKSVGLDSLSELQMVNLDSVVSQMVGKAGRSGSKRDNLDDVWLEDYGTSTQQLRRVVRQFRDLPMHVFAVCAEATSQDKDKNESAHPALTPKLRSSVLAYMDVVGYQFIKTEGDKTTRCLLTQPYDKWVSKDRSPGQRLGQVVDEPSIPKIMDLILGKKE